MKTTVCAVNDVVPNSGRAVLLEGSQVAIFRVTLVMGEKMYAIDNYCPFSQANVLSRGIVGTLRGKVVVASPIYKQHFDLETGICLEDERVRVTVWSVEVSDGNVLIGEKIKAAA